MISLSDPSIDGYTFTRLMNTAPESAIIVLEDVDAAFVSRTPTTTTTTVNDTDNIHQPNGKAGFSVTGMLGLDDKHNKDMDDGESSSNNSTSGGVDGIGGHRTSSNIGEGNGAGEVDAVPEGTGFAGNARPDIKLSFSDLLNGLDGLAAQEGRILFMTTNHRHKLDPALIRPGRIDLQLEFPLATTDQAIRLFKHFFGEFRSAPDGAASDIRETQQEIAEMANQFGAVIPDSKFSMALIQGYLMRFRRSPKTAVEKVHEFVEQQLTNGARGTML
jgi:chaperone BCS1